METLELGIKFASILILVGCMNLRIIILLICLSLISEASLFPIHFGKNTEVLVIDNPVDDEVVRLGILGTAQKSIDIITHTQTTGEFGLKIIATLRDRMANNVRIRYLYEKIASMGVGETSDRAVRLLTDQELYNPTKSKLIISRPLEKVFSPFTITDLLHEKMIIVDKGTSNEVLLIGGRNHDEFGVTSSDFTFVIRRIDQTKPYLGDSLQEHFDDLYGISERYFSVEKARVLSHKEKKSYVEDINRFQVKVVSEKANSILDTLASPAKLSDTPKEFQFFPDKTRLVTNDLLKTISENKLPRNHFVRRDLLRDDITSYFAGLVENSSRLELTSYILSMPDMIKDSIRDMLSQGGEFLSYSNDGLAYGRKLPLKSLGNAVHSMNIESYFDFTAKSEASSVNMFTLDSSQGMRRSAPIDYNHRKVAVLDIKNAWSKGKSDMPKRIVFTGSYNFTLSSASKNDEMAIMFDSTRMANYISGINQRDADAFYLKMDPSEAAQILKRNKLTLKICRRFFESVF